MHFPNRRELERCVMDRDDISAFRKRVRMRILSLLGEQPLSIEQLAHDLALSARTLQRRLRSEGTSYQNEVNQLRADLARYYLTNTRYSGTEIAYRLGYNDANSFFRAFHNWTGQTPHSVRRKA